ncbi:hypothetical protein BV25DRAFT_1839163 [Artomyces pyxidatus]|uniref:Uncharacterized protein n=1 Tax=Artomyces pyxidatus TaxID=48021 RepID=A0ACB8SZF3_9AGAM|nr:hypothetical protein BV25DRAFT_1839163 [Artomyces pyxidatus]
MDILISSRPQYLSELDSNGWETPEDGSKGWSSGWGSTEDVIDAEWGAGREHKRPPLLVKLTGFRLLNMAVIMGLGVPKAVTSYQGGSAVPTTLDWVVGVFSASLLYWLGLYESIEPPVLVWFFHTDFSFTLVGPIVSAGSAAF